METEHHQTVTNIVHSYANGRIAVEDAVQQFRTLLHEYRESDRVPFETLYACVNDCPLPVLADEPLVVAGRAEYPQQQAMFEDRAEAVEERDRIREQSGNQAINVYRLTVESVAEGGSR